MVNKWQWLDDIADEAPGSQARSWWTVNVLCVNNNWAITISMDSESLELKEGDAGEGCGVDKVSGLEEIVKDHNHGLVPQYHIYFPFRLRRIRSTFLTYNLSLPPLQHHQRAPKIHHLRNPRPHPDLQQHRPRNRNTSSKERHSYIPAVLRTRSACAQRGNFAKIWEPAITACGSDTSLTNSTAPFPRCRNTGSNCNIKACCEDPPDELGDTFAALIEYNWDVVRSAQDRKG